MGDSTTCLVTSSGIKDYVDNHKHCSIVAGNTSITTYQEDIYGYAEIILNGVVVSRFQGTHLWLGSDFTNNNGRLQLKQDSELRCFMGESTRVWVGVDSADSKLQLQSNGSGVVELIGAGSTFVAGDGAFYPNSDDAYDCGSLSKRWDDIYATNTSIQSSDEKLKVDIKPLSYGLDIVNKFKPISFKWAPSEIVETHIVDLKNEEGAFIQEEFIETYTKIPIRRHFGFSAQQIKSVLDEKEISTENFAAWVEDDSGRLGIRQGELVPILWKAVQELSDRLKQLEENNGQTI